MKSVSMHVVPLLALFLLTFTLTASSPGDDEAPTIKQIMKDGFKGGLVRSVGTGKATPEEQQKLLKFAQQMEKLNPPQGEADSWKEKTKAFTSAVQAVIDGDEGAAAQLMKASNCAACHKPHKPS